MVSSIRYTMAKVAPLMQLWATSPRKNGWRELRWRASGQHGVETQSLGAWCGLLVIELHRLWKVLRSGWSNFWASDN